MEAATHRTQIAQFYGFWTEALEFIMCSVAWLYIYIYVRISFYKFLLSLAHRIIQFLIPWCVCKACWDGVIKPLTGWITPKVSTAQPQAVAPQLEACLRHALPLCAHLMVGLGECVITHIPVGGNRDITWNYRRVETDILIVEPNGLSCSVQLLLCISTFSN